MTAKEALNLKVGDIVTPVYGLDEGIPYKITKIEQNPYCKKRVEISITAVPLETCKSGSSWKTITKEWNYIDKVGQPSYSGHYEVLIRGGKNEDYVEKDDYTNVQKIWWNSLPIAWREIV